MTGVRAVSHRETTGIGDAIEHGRSAWILRFDGLVSGRCALTADGGRIDAITGASVTSRAVVEGVRDAVADASSDAATHPHGSVRMSSMSDSENRLARQSRLAPTARPVSVARGDDERRSTRLRIGAATFAVLLVSQRRHLRAAQLHTGCRAAAGIHAGDRLVHDDRRDAAASLRVRLVPTRSRCSCRSSSRIASFWRTPIASARHQTIGRRADRQRRQPARVRRGAGPGRSCTRQGAAYGLPLAAIPPGAFLIAALLLAAKNAWAART